MCYGFGLRENELNEASPAFVSLFLQGCTERDFENSKTNWEQARLVASAMSKAAAKIKFSWEKAETRGYALNIPQEVWDRFTPDFTGQKVSPDQIKKYLKN